MKSDIKTMHDFSGNSVSRTSLLILEDVVCLIILLFFEIKGRYSLFLSQQQDALECLHMLITTQVSEVEFEHFKSLQVVKKVVPS